MEWGEGRGSGVGRVGGGAGTEDRRERVDPWGKGKGAGGRMKSGGLGAGFLLEGGGVGEEEEEERWWGGF